MALERECSPELNHHGVELKIGSHADLLLDVGEAVFGEDAEVQASERQGGGIFDVDFRKEPCA